MNFPELCERLIRELGEARVRSPEYPGLGTNALDKDPWILRFHDRKYDVGASERGNWISTQMFDTESEACEFLYSILTKPTRIKAESPEERAESERLTAEYFQKLTGRSTRM